MVGVMCYSMHYLTGISHVGEKLKVGESISVISIKDLMFYLTIWFLVFYFVVYFISFKLATYWLYLSKNIQNI